MSTRRGSEMKTILKLNFALLYFVFLTGGIAQANRLLDETKKAEHCHPLPAAKCAPSLLSWKNKGCITQKEYDGALQASPIPVPFCVDMSAAGDGPWEFNSWCYCSCFAKGTRILVEDITTQQKLWVAIETVVDHLEQYSLIVPTQDSSLRSMKYKTVGIEKFTVGHEENPLLIISLEDGSEITLTGNHQVLVANGRLLEAAKVAVGSSLVKFNGTPVKVIAIQYRQTTDDVYNILTESRDDLSHFIFAEGLTVGDLLWENTLEQHLNSLQFPPN